MKKITNAKKGVKQALIISTVITSPFVITSDMLWAAEGLTAKFTVGQRLQYSNETGVTNPEDEGFRSRTDLGLSLNSQTRNQSLSFNARSGLTYAFSDTPGVDRLQVEDPLVQLSYAIDNRSSQFKIDGSYRRADVDDTPFITDPLLEDEDIITGAGRRETLSLRTGLTLGEDAPLTFSLNHFYGQTNYSGVTDPTLVDTETNGIDGRLTFQISPVASANISASWRELDAEGPGSNDRLTERVSVGGSYDISPVLTATAQISHQNIETDDNAGTITQTDGIGYRFGLTRALDNGALSFNLQEDTTVNGKRRQFNVGRNYDLKRGTFSFSIGTTKTEGLKTGLLANIAANYQLDPRSNLTGSLSQSSQVSNNNETTINTRFGLTYARDLNEQSMLTAELQLTDRNARSAGAENQTSLRLNLSHRYQLGGDWDLVSGYSYSNISRDTQPDRKTSTLFMGIEKTFDYRP